MSKEVGQPRVKSTRGQAICTMELVLALWAKKNSHYWALDTQMVLALGRLFCFPRSTEKQDNLIGTLVLSWCLFFFFSAFLWLLLRHMEVPRLGIKSDPYSCQPTPQPQQCKIQAMYATYTTAHGNTGCLTHWARPVIETASPWMLVRFITTEPWGEHQVFSLSLFFFLYFFGFLGPHPQHMVVPG